MSKSPRDAGPESRPRITPHACDRPAQLPDASGAAVGAAASRGAPAQPAQAAEAHRWDHEVDVVVIGAGAGGLTSAHRGAREGRIGADRREEFRHRRPRHDELRRALYRRRQPDAEGDRHEGYARSRCSRTGRARKSRWAASATASWCAPMPTTISICSIGWRSTASSGKATGRRPTVSIARARGSNVVPWPNEVTNPGRGSGFVRPLAKTARADGHRDPAAAADDEDPPRGAAGGTRDRHHGDRGRQLVPAEIPRP